MDPKDGHLNSTSGHGSSCDGPTDANHSHPDLGSGLQCVNNDHVSSGVPGPVISSNPTLDGCEVEGSTCPSDEYEATDMACDFDSPVMAADSSGWPSTYESLASLQADLSHKVWYNKFITWSPENVIFYLILGSLQHVLPGLSSCWYCGASVAHFSTQSCVVMKSNDDIQNNLFL
jgi:hypothetical protein